jgi:hypothetical protein
MKDSALIRCISLDPAAFLNIKYNFRPSRNRICTVMHSRQGGMILRNIDPLFDARDSAFKDFEEKEETKKENGSGDVERRSRSRGRRNDD